MLITISTLTERLRAMWTSKRLFSEQKWKVSGEIKVE
jgi:hypothetical protein